MRIHLRVSGRVQGVFYRASARDRALALGLRGWVRNRRDGSVELVADGDAGALDQLARWCAEGPPSARVDSLQRVDAPDADGADPADVGVGFEVRPTA